MPSVINIGNVNVNTPQQNSAVFFGESIISGWDAHQKYNIGSGGYYGYLNFANNGFNVNFDGNEVIDGMVNYQDIKSISGGAMI